MNFFKSDFFYDTVLTISYSYIVNDWLLLLSSMASLAGRVLDFGSLLMNSLWVRITGEEVQQMCGPVRIASGKVKRRL